MKAGRSPLLHSEDVLRYGAKGMRVNKEAVVNLFKSVRNHPGVDSVAMSHFSLASVATAPDLVEEISCILGADEKHWLSAQTGIETGSPELMQRHLRGKCKPFATEEWPHVVLKAFEIMSENNWVPCATLIMGLPKETDRDVELTVSLVEELKSFKSLIVPLFLVGTGALKGRTESFTVDKMTRRHNELFVTCWEHNLEWASAIIKDWINMTFRTRIFRHGLHFAFSYGIKQARKLLSLCRDDYGSDLSAMIKDLRARRTEARPLLIRLARPLLQLRQ